MQSERILNLYLNKFAIINNLRKWLRGKKSQIPFTAAGLNDINRVTNGIWERESQK